MKVQDVRLGQRVWRKSNGPMDAKAFERSWEVVRIEADGVAIGGPGHFETCTTVQAEDIEPFEVDESRSSSRYRLRVVLYDQGAAMSEIYLDPGVEARIIQEEVWSQTVWPEGQVALADLVREVTTGRPAVSPTVCMLDPVARPEVAWTTRFVATRPSACEGLIMGLRMIGYQVEADPTCTPSGMDMMTMEPYRAYRTTAPTDMVLSSAWACDIESFVPSTMCGAYGTS